MLEFLPGERLKFINVTIVDNPVPELEKIFRVELFNADGGGEKYKPYSNLEIFIYRVSCFIVQLNDLALCTVLCVFVCGAHLLPLIYMCDYLPTPSYLPFDLYSFGVILTWSDTPVILMWGLSVYRFLHGEEAGSGEGDSNFLQPSYHHHGKYSLPLLLK